MDCDPRPRLAGLIREHEITITFVPGAPPSPNFPNANPWTVTLHRPGAVDYTMPFYMGPGLVDERAKKITTFNKESWEWERKAPPAQPDVLRFLDCQLSDAQTVESTRGFDDWCSDLGYSNDSIKARDTYHICAELALRLRQFLGPHYDTFLYADRD